MELSQVYRRCRPSPPPRENRVRMGEPGGCGNTEQAPETSLRFWESFLEKEGGGGIGGGKGERKGGGGGDGEEEETKRSLIAEVPVDSSVDILGLE